MTPERLMRSRVNAAFLIMCLTLALQSVATFPTLLFQTLALFGVTYDPYYVDFVVPQILYPLLLGGAMIVALLCLKIPLRRVMKVSAPKGDLVLWMGLFLGVSTVMNYLIYWGLLLLEQVGIVIPDVFAAYEPETVLQAIFYVFVLAFLPPISEEILCRAGIAGPLKHFHPWVAVFVSAFGFGLMHATVQQIPFAFALGLVLGFVYLKTGNFLYPVLLHFANNAWACALTILSVKFGDEAVGLWSTVVDVIFLLWGVVSLILLLRKKRLTLSEIPRSLDTPSALRAVATAPAFWVFTGLYILMTIAVLASSFLIA